MCVCVCVCVCVSFGVAETKIALGLKFIVRYIMLQSQLVLYLNDKVLLALPHHTVFGHGFVSVRFCFTSQLTIFQSCRDGATASWVLPVRLGVKCILLKDTTRRPD